MTRISLLGIECSCRIGVPEGERELPQRIVLDLGLEQAAQVHEGYVDYQKVYERALEIAQSRPFVLVEDLAAEIASELLQNFRSLQSVKVTARKRPAVMPGVDVVLELEKSR